MSGSASFATILFQHVKDLLDEHRNEMVRKYGIGTGLIWIFALLALFVINVLGGIFGLIELLRCNNFQEVRRACYVLLLNVLPWIILGVLYWVYMSD